MTIREEKKESSIEFEANNSSQEKEIVLSVENLKTYFPVYGGFFKREIAEVKAVDGVSFNLKRGETLALVGESGCGKTTIGNSILNLVLATEGEVYLKNKLIVVGRENIAEILEKQEEKEKKRAKKKALKETKKIETKEEKKERLIEAQKEKMDMKSIKKERRIAEGDLPPSMWIIILSCALLFAILCAHALLLPLTPNTTQYLEGVLYVNIIGSIILLFLLRKHWQKIYKSKSSLQNSLLKQKTKFILIATALGIYLFLLFALNVYKTGSNLVLYFDLITDPDYIPLWVMVFFLMSLIFFNPTLYLKIYLMILIWRDNSMKLKGKEYKNPDSYLSKYHKRLMIKVNVYSKDVRKKIQLVFQDPDSSLNPRWKVVNIIGEPLRALLKMRGAKKNRRKVLELLETVSMKNEHLDRYPHEFSGGQKQRIVISRALACNPEVIVLDEPTSALDVSVQAQILNLLKDLQKKFNLAFLFITHDLSVVQHIADRVAVMYLGKFVEIGKVDDVFYNPSHPYTKALLSARPTFDPSSRTTRIILKGEIPSPINPPMGCAFHPRCYAQDQHMCDTGEPVKIKISEDHYIWCKPLKKK